MKKKKRKYEDSKCEKKTKKHESTSKIKADLSYQRASHPATFFSHPITSYHILQHPTTFYSHPYRILSHPFTSYYILLNPVTTTSSHPPLTELWEGTGSSFSVPWPCLGTLKQVRISSTKPSVPPAYILENEAAQSVHWNGRSESAGWQKNKQKSFVIKFLCISKNIIISHWIWYRK